MLKRSFRAYIAPLALTLTIGFMLAACGSTSGNAGGIYGSTTSPTNTPASTSSAATLKLTSISINGTSKMVLTDGNGMTLYYRSDDNASSPACTGGCASAWPPFLTNAGAPTAPSGATEPISVVTGANGAQVEYNGWPLYTFKGDTAPGGHAGEGLQGIWHVAAPASMTTPAPSGSSTKATPTPGDGYGYGH
jgi:predicted lipoprotein with Yx(FWY)xxD motif